MTTGSDPRRIAGSPVYLPRLASEGRSGEGHAQAYTRIRARGASPAPEQPPAGHVPSATARRFAAVLAWLDELFKVGQLWRADPPSLADEWHRQAESARIFERTPLLRWIRWCWAPFPVVIGALVFLWIWATFHPLRALLIAAAVWLVLYLL